MKGASCRVPTSCSGRLVRSTQAHSVEQTAESFSPTHVGRVDRPGPRGGRPAHLWRSTMKKPHVITAVPVVMIALLVTAAPAQAGTRVPVVLVDDQVFGSETSTFTSDIPGC